MRGGNATNGGHKSVKERRKNMKYRVREGSIADYARIAIVSAGFWAVILWAIVTTY